MPTSRVDPDPFLNLPAMHILYVTPYAPNLIRTRPYNLIRHLARRGHELTVLATVSDASEQADLDELASDRIVVLSEPLTRVRSIGNSLLGLFSRDPMQAAYCWQPALASRLEVLLAASNGRRPVDVVHVEHLRGARYALHAQRVISRAQPRAADIPRVPVVWDSVDCISHLFRQAAVHSASRAGRWVTRFELPRTERYEGWLVGQFDTVLVTSTVDQEALAKLSIAFRSKTPAIEVLPNGVDLDYFHPDPYVQRDPAMIVVTGKMSYHANITMAVFLVREIMPLIWARRPDARVEIVGKNPAPAVRALANHPAVQVTGTVPDIRPYLQRATLVAAPTVYGAGVQNKVLEAMACGTAVVATPQSTAGLNAIDGRDLVTGQAPDELAAAILTLMAEPMRCADLGEAGRCYVEREHSWEGIAGSLESLYSVAREEPGSHIATTSAAPHD